MVGNYKLTRLIRRSPIYVIPHKTILFNILFDIFWPNNHPMC